MTYDYRSYLNTIISLLTSIQSILQGISDTLSSFFSLFSDFADLIMGNFFSVLLFILLFVGLNLVCRLFFPRWRDV